MFNRRIGLLAIAVGLMSGGLVNGGAGHGIAQGEAMMFSLRNKYREQARFKGRKSGAASAKRASVKRRNIAKNPRSLHGRKRTA